MESLPVDALDSVGGLQKGFVRNWIRSGSQKKATEQDEKVMTKSNEKVNKKEAENTISDVLRLRVVGQVKKIIESV